jgi:hypothetical protein
MDQDRHRRLYPTVNAVRYHSVLFYANEVGGGWAAASAARDPLSTGPVEAASRDTRIAWVCRVSAVGTWRGGRGAMPGTSEHMDGAPGDARLGGSMVAIMNWD